jgi:hypothetical protein
VALLRPSTANATGSGTVIDPAQVVLPSIFDAYAQPDALPPLVLANLLSPQLWELAARVASRAAADAPVVDDELPPALRAAQREIDRRFEHLTPVRTAGVFGEIDLDAEGARLGADVVAGAIARIAEGFRWRLELGQIDAALVDAVSAMIAQRRFPAYHYATFDVIRASSHAAATRRRVPLGLTSCLDEAAIFSALVMTLPAGTVDSVVVLGAPDHYTVFGWNEAGVPWWFYGKNCLLSARDWRRLVAEQHGGDAQRAFDARFRLFDRIVTVDGTFDLASGRCEIPAVDLEAIVAAIDRCFGARPQQLAAALARPLAPQPPSPFAPLFLDLLALESLAAVRDHIDRLAGSALDPVIALVLYAYRSLVVGDLAPYLAAARRSHACAKLGPGIGSLDEALALVRAIPGRTSMFGDRRRIAMPEETLRVQTGSDVDRALLLHVLLESVPALGPAHGAIETWFDADGAFVVGPDFCIGAQTMTHADPGAARTAKARRIG